eukprot:symbB.v1.2.020966.t1/scaffold1791.1/size101237/6
MYGPVASAFTGAGSAVSKEAATYAWNFVENFQKYDATDEDAASKDLSDSSSTPNVTYKQLLSTLRTFDPDVTYEQIAWVLGKEEARGNTIVTFNEIWQNLDDGDLDKLDVDPLEQSFARLVDQNQEYLDLQKVGNALQSAGIHGVTEDIMEKCTRRIRELARENVRDARGKKKDDIDFRDYRRLFAMTEGVQETSL